MIETIAKILNILYATRKKFFLNIKISFKKIEQKVNKQREQLRQKNEERRNERQSKSEEIRAKYGITLC